MARLEDIVQDARVTGLDPRGVVTIIAAKQHGKDILEVTFKNSQGVIAQRILGRDAEACLSLNPPGPTFNGDGAKLRLVSEAWRIHYAHLFDPYLAVHTSDVEPLPHQITAVYQEMLGRLPLRYVLADDPGAGKTIMTGLFIRELAARGDLARCLIVCPGSLAEQWQEELFQKFGLRYEILNRDRMEAAVTGNIFTEVNLAIARLDTLSRDEALKKKLEATDWDLIVCDEAHKMSATINGTEVKRTRRYQLGQLLSRISRNFLLLTATPHNGKEDDFQLFLSLVDQDRFSASGKTCDQPANVSGVMRRLVKEQLLKFNGRPLFPDRKAITLNYGLSPLESRLYENVTTYVQSQFNNADKLAKKRRVTVGFALTVLQRRLASSPEAIYQSLRRRRERLQKRLSDERPGRSSEVFSQPEDFDEDDLPSGELEELEERIADEASASTSRAELEAEIHTLEKLEELARELRSSGTDRKWEELSDLLQEEDRMFDKSGIREKLIIFTEHRDTLAYLADRIRCLIGDPEAVVTIHGGMGRDERHHVEERFRQDKTCRVLVATDAAGEGLNLQRAHLMVNYDLPWNPNRLEQRFGRIHRIGQPHTCWLWNLVASETREGAVFQRLFQKLERERAALGGKVFDVLGKVSFNERPLRELLIEAVRLPDAKDNLAINEQIDAAFDRDKLLDLLREHALSDDIMDVGIVEAVREQMERMETRRLQPHFIEAFFREAFTSLGGSIKKREFGRHEITHVPPVLLARPVQGREPVLRRYERVCFDRRHRHGEIQASLICPGHPLLQALLDYLREQYSGELETGAILLDDNDPGDAPRLLFYLETIIQDGTILPNGSHNEISRHIHFVELDENGLARNAGPAPYLDYRPPEKEELAALLPYAASRDWQAHEEKARTYAITEIAPGHLAEIRAARQKLVAKTRKAVIQRLNAEIQYWDARAEELYEREKAGKRNAGPNSAQARKRADELQIRLNKRLAELDAEKKINSLPPRISGRCLVIPRGLLNRLVPGNAQDSFTADAAARKKIELAAMNAVMAREAEFGYLPRDVSSENRGYDIESAIPEHLRPESGASLRFIEVKGRIKGAASVTLTRNEILTCLNNPEQYILALVEVDGDNATTTYLKKPFKSLPDFSVQYCTYNLASLIKTSELVF